ncbi:hypothetical protein IID22_02965 [Patescibacteria group bacterium]|nr:hypothetical protein [Patescibacteria group bacterium]
MKIKKFVLPLTFLAIVLLLLFLIKGEKGSPIYHQSPAARDTDTGGPFESSGSTSRYILTEAIVEDGTFILNEERAKFAAPDVSKYNDTQFSIFSPGTAFFGIPFYLVGKQVGLPQLITYASTAIIAALSVFIVTKIARMAGAGFYSSLLAGFLYLFATNALTYSLSYTQHILSTFLILLAALSALGKRTLLSNIWFGILYGFGILVDIPNGIMMLPLILYVLYKQFEIKDRKNKISLKLKLSFVGLLIGLIPMLSLFGWYNYKLTGSFVRVAQRIGRAEDFETEPVGEQLQGDSRGEIELPFKTRNLSTGFYILLTSDQRGFLVYSPVLLIGILGFYILYKKKEKKSIGILLAGVVLANLIVYASIGDPTGSWAFGPRYLIPSAAILAVFTGVAIDKYKRKSLFVILFIILSAYSIGVNVMGAMTTTQVPPKEEAVNLPDPVPYTFERNWQLMVEEGLNSSLVYNLYLSNKLTSKDYALIYTSAIFVLIATLYLSSFAEKRRPKIL